MKRIILFLLSLFLGLFNAIAEDVTFKATAPQSVAVGQKFYLKYTTNVEPEDFTTPDLSKFSILSGPEVSKYRSVNYINGQYQAFSTYTYTYVLVANAEGLCTISPAKFTYNGKTQMSNSVAIKVLPASAASNNAHQNQRQSQIRSQQSSEISDNDVLCIAEYDRKKVYEQEQIFTTITLYHQGNIVELENMKFPEYKGFVCQEIDVKDEERNIGVKVYNGRKYYAYILKKAILFPQRAGELEIEDGNTTVIMQVNRRGNVFDFPFGMPQNIRKDLVIKGTKMNITPLPANGKTDDFCGGVGSFKLESSINATEVKANEPINLKVKISGSGNLKYMKDPQIEFPKDFEAYDPKVTYKIKASENGVSGSKEIEYLVIPRFAGTYDIPAQKFSYFDVKSKSYKTLQTEPYTITVEKGENSGDGNTSVVSNYNTKEDVRFLGKDIRFINTKNIEVKSETTPFFGTTFYYLWLLIPLCIFTTLFILYRKQLKENSNITLVKNKRANKLATKRLKKAAQHLSADEREPFYEEIFKALWGYTSDKLNIPVAELDKESIHEKLSEHKVDEEVIKEFIDVLNTCEFARFAPSGGHGEMDSFYEKAVELIGKLEEQIKK